MCLILGVLGLKSAQNVNILQGEDQDSATYLDGVLWGGMCVNILHVSNNIV